jgi:hypothetical protein
MLNVLLAQSLSAEIVYVRRQLSREMRFVGQKRQTSETYSPGEAEVAFHRSNDWK